MKSCCGHYKGHTYYAPHVTPLTEGCPYPRSNFPYNYCPVCGGKLGDTYIVEKHITEFYQVEAIDREDAIHKHLGQEPKKICFNSYDIYRKEV